MGCDIHFFVEYKAGNKKWEADEDHQVYYEVYEGEIEYDIGGYVGDLGTEYKEVTLNNGKVVKQHDWKLDSDKPGVGRDYMLFGFLADVRSSWGSAIYKPRGVPEDASPEIQMEYERWRGDAHSASYLSIDEFEHVVREYRKSAILDAIQSHEESEKYKTIYQDVIDYIRANQKKRIYKCPEGLFDVEVEARVVFWFDN